MMLKGGGTVPPSSKYEIHNLLLANFHSMSAFSCEIVVKILVRNFTKMFGLLLTKKSISWELKNHAEGNSYTLLKFHDFPIYHLDFT